MTINRISPPSPESKIAGWLEFAFAAVGFPLYLIGYQVIGRVIRYYARHAPEAHQTEKALVRFVSTPAGRRAQGVLVEGHFCVEVEA